MNLYTKQKKNHRYRRQTYSYQMGKGWGRDKLVVQDQEIQTTINKIDIKNLLYSAGNYI